MSDPRDFEFWVENDRIRVRHVTPKGLTRISSGQTTGADYHNKTIRVLRGDILRSRRAYVCHELSHYICERLDMRKQLTQEDACDLMPWLVYALHDERNGKLRSYLGLETK